MKYLNKLLILITLSLSLYSCAELRGDGTGANEFSFDTLVGGTGSIEIDNGDSSEDPTTKKYLLQGQAANVNTGANFQLKFKLPENAILTFHFYAFSDLSNGQDIRFTRSNGKVFMTMSTNSVTHTQELVDYEDIEELDLSIDVHNDHPNIHTLIWKADGPFGDSEECFFDGDCVYNTESFAIDDNFDPLWSNGGKASGPFWGFTGDRDLIIELEGYLDALSNV